MPVCQNCHYKWSWKETFKRSFTFGNAMICPHCEEKQYLSARLRKRSTIIPFMIISIIMLCNLFFGPSYFYVITLISLLPLFFGIYPFFVELSNEEEPLF